MAKAHIYLGLILPLGVALLGGCPADTDRIAHPPDPSHSGGVAPTAATPEWPGGGGDEQRSTPVSPAPAADPAATAQGQPTLGSAASTGQPSVEEDVPALAVPDGAGAATVPLLALPSVSPTAGAASTHQAALVVDMHVDTVWQMHKHGDRFESRSSKLQADSRALRAGDVDAQFFSIWLPPDSRRPLRLAHELIDLFEREVLASPHFELASDAEDVVEIASRGHVAALLGLEGAVALESDPENIRKLYERGVRYAALTWNESNPFGDGAKSDSHRGITPRGEALVRLLNELGILVDVSHASRDTFWGVVATSRRPVIASHSNARVIADHPRNLDDTQLWAIAESGGVVGLNFHSAFLRTGGRRASLQDLLRHAQHIAAVAGWETLGLGTDFDGDIREPVDIRKMNDLPRLTDALLRAGVTPKEVAGVLGHNVLRTLHETRTGQLRAATDRRPAQVDEALATSGGASAELAYDRNARTAWTAASAPGEERENISMEIVDPGLLSVAVVGSSPQQASSVLEVEVDVRDPASDFAFRGTLALTPAVRPHRIQIPGAPCHSRLFLTVSITKRAPGTDPAQLSEIVPEVRVSACPTRP